MSTLFDPVKLGAPALRNRIIMAPMTRSRAGAGDAPTALNVTYYRQRAAAGLIVTEGTQPSVHGKGYGRTPGIHTQAQIAGWKHVTSAVHEEGGCIVLQLMHCGRIGTHHNKNPGAETVAPSALQAQGRIFSDTAGRVGFDVPRALQEGEIPGVVNEFAQAALNARTAGFDGVELHVTSGYLPMQFLSTSTNQRTDAYGGTLVKRLRLMVETLEALSHVIGADRVGFRICPGNPFNDIHDENRRETYIALLKAVSTLQWAYVHAIRSPLSDLDTFELARRHSAGSIILNDGLNLDTAQTALGERVGKAVSFARPFIANPDLVEWFQQGLPLAAFNSKMLYTPGADGYTSYPSFDGQGVMAGASILRKV